MQSHILLPWLAAKKSLSAGKPNQQSAKFLSLTGSPVAAPNVAKIFYMLSIWQHFLYMPGLHQGLNEQSQYVSCCMQSLIIQCSAQAAISRQLRT